MEKNANYTLVGFGCLLLLFTATIFTVWLAKVQFSRDYDVYNILFVGPVRGLGQGGEVHFNGIKVGEVTKIMLDPTNPARVIAQARVTSDVPIKKDSYATLEPEGITGVNYVQIASGSAAAPLLRETVSFGQIPVLPGRRGPLDDLLQGGGAAMLEATEALRRVNRVLSDDNIASLTATFSDVRAIGDEFRVRKSLIGDTQKTVQDADVAVVRLTELEKAGEGLLGGDAKRTLRNLGDAGEEAAAATHQLRGLIDRIDGPVSDFAANGLPQVTAAVVDLQRTTESMDRLMKDVRADPRGFITKNPPNELEVRQ